MDAMTIMALLGLLGKGAKAIGGLFGANAEEQKNDLRFTLEKVKETIDQLSGVDGRKIFIHVSEGLPQSPGAEVWQYIQDKFRDQSPAMMQFEFNQTPLYAGLVVLQPWTISRTAADVSRVCEASAILSAVA